jgi:hypothetical protein
MRLKFPRIALLSVVLLASAFFVDGASHGATTAVPSGLPLYQFVETGTQPLPWNAQSLQKYLNTTTMLGGPHSASNATEGVLAYRTNKSQLAVLTQTTSLTTQWMNYSLQNNVPEPADDPIPFFDPSNNVDLLYVDISGHVILLSPNDPDTPLWNNTHQNQSWRPYITTDLSDLTGVVASVGLPSIQVQGSSATVAYRTSKDAIEVLTLNWNAGQSTPIYSQNAYTISSVAQSTTTTTTTTLPTTSTSSTTTTHPTTTTTTVPVSSATSFASDPVVLPGPYASFATTLNNGNLIVYANTGAAFNSWATQNLTMLTGTPGVTGTLSLGISTSTIDLVGLTSIGAVELFSTQYVAPVAGFTSSSFEPVWNTQNLTTLASGAPPLSGALSVQVSASQVAVAGQAANWGDLFVLTNISGSTSWTATDVSVTAGSSARTVGNIVASLELNGQLSLYAAGVNSPPPQGVGVYAIPSAKWSKAITDGWPIISETGGLGTQSAPWVNFTTATSVATSPDFLLGQAIYNSHKRTTWLSFWTVSGPLANQAQTTTNFYSHGFAAGVWVATQIDAYRGLGVGLKPDWVIFDPEGYPDNHSGLDAPAGSSAATIKKYATYWASMVGGWKAGLNSVDSSLNAGVYASQSEYRNYSLSSLAEPVFMAIAFSGNGPTALAGASGSNVRGFISFGAVCTPASTLASEASTLLNPPWAGQFNTLQFNAGVYCAPPPT